MPADKSARRKTRLKSALPGYLLPGLSIIAIITLSAVLQVTVVSNPDRFANWLASFGPFFYLIYVLIHLASIVVAPIGGAFILYTLIALIGPLKALILSYFVSTPAYTINFLLARRWGRPIVRQLVGQQGMAKIDHYAQDAGTRLLVILKVFQGGYFDYISYAAGLTQIRLRDFLIVNILGGIPSTVVIYLVFARSPNFLTSIIILQLVGGVMIVLSLLLTHRHKHK